MFDRDLDGTHLRRAMVAGAVGGDDDLAKADSGREGVFARDISRKGDGVEQRLIAHKRNFEESSISREGERETAIDIGDGTLAGTGIEDGSTYQGLTRSGIGDETADGMFLSP